ncbi:MAG: hypothetical protein IJM44_06905 [Ruminococcus sp.]|nr:hypothetical protein [Ruminococcus sp.]
MSRKDELRELFSNPFMSDYMAHCDETVRRAVTGISAACDLIGGSPEECGQSRRIILDMCRSIMRTAELSGALADAADGEVKRELTDIDSFLSELVLGCNGVLGERADISVRERCGAAVLTDRTLLTFFMLSVLRRAVIASPGKPVIELYSAAEGGRVTVSVTASENGGTPAEGGFFGEVSQEMNELLAEKLGAEIKVGGGELMLCFRAETDGAMSVLASDLVKLGDGVFSPFGVMLGDLAE